MQITTMEAAPHGGMLIETEAGFVEISVFETGIPPQFRLYFFDAQRRPKAPPENTVTLETSRPDGAAQNFDFVQQGSFLKSVQDIPEPHEFDVVLRLSSEPSTTIYQEI